MRSTFGFPPLKRGGPIEARRSRCRNRCRIRCCIRNRCRVRFRSSLSGLLFALLEVVRLNVVTEDRLIVTTRGAVPIRIAVEAIFPAFRRRFGASGSELRGFFRLIWHFFRAACAKHDCQPPDQKPKWTRHRQTVHLALSLQACTERSCSALPRGICSQLQNSTRGKPRLGHSCDIYHDKRQP